MFLLIQICVLLNNRHLLSHCCFLCMFFTRMTKGKKLRLKDGARIVEKNIELLKPKIGEIVCLPACADTCTASMFSDEATMYVSSVLYVLLTAVQLHHHCQQMLHLLHHVFTPHTPPSNKQNILTYAHESDLTVLIRSFCCHHPVPCRCHHPLRKGETSLC